jgi:hypothetical protein
MKFQFALLAVALAPVVAALKAGSKAGQKLLSKARRLNDEVDYSWVASYSIQFDKCHSLIQVAGEEQAQDGGSMIYTYNLVTFSLCPSDTCGTSSKHTGCAQYVVGMDIFVDMYTETKLEEQEAACEYVRENCNADDDGGENQCYIDAGLEDCIEVEGGEEFEIQRYLECAELEGNDNNNNNGNYYNNANNYRYNQYFIGPYCSSDGNSITLAIFYDEGCSAKATETDIYSTLMGTELPFSSESIVKNDCISCKEVDEDEDGNNNNNQNDQDDADELIEFCEELYASSGKCETNVASTATYADESACNYINTILPRLEANSKSITNGSSTGDATAAKVFAWLFACTTLALGAYAFLLFRKLRRSKTNLADQGSLADHGGMADHGGEIN